MSEDRDINCFGRLAEARSVYDLELRAVADLYVSYFACGKSSTARAKRCDLDRFCSWCAGYVATERPLLLADVTPQEIADFRDEAFYSGEAASTVNRRLATIKHFFGMVAKVRREFLDPALGARWLREDVAPFRGATFEEVNAMANAGARKALRPGFEAARGRFAIWLLFWTGLRAEEALRLRLGQYEGQVLSKVGCKAGRVRRVVVPDALQEEIAAWLPVRAERVERLLPAAQRDDRWGDFPLLVSLRHATAAQPASLRLSQKSLWRIVQASAAAVGVPGVHPHTLRHALAYYLLSVSRDIRLVAQALGHADVKTTLRYTERPEEEILKALNAKRRA